MTGFWISQICVRGSKVADATLTFQRGLNVLSGGSDTGKSYLLGCIPVSYTHLTLPTKA